MCVVDANIHGARILGKENCLVRTAIIGFEAINCFYDNIGFICESKGNPN